MPLVTPMPIARIAMITIDSAGRRISCRTAFLTLVTVFCLCYSAASDSAGSTVEARRAGR